LLLLLLLVVGLLMLMLLLLQLLLLLLLGLLLLLCGFACFAFASHHQPLIFSTCCHTTAATALGLDGCAVGDSVFDWLGAPARRFT
jgi:hypothetical protein